MIMSKSMTLDEKLIFKTKLKLRMCMKIQSKQDANDFNFSLCLHFSTNAVIVIFVEMTKLSPQMNFLSLLTDENEPKYHTIIT